LVGEMVGWREERSGGVEGGEEWWRSGWRSRV
jgi:hypothetical protein